MLVMWSKVLQEAVEAPVEGAPQGAPKVEDVAPREGKIPASDKASSDEPEESSAEMWDSLMDDDEQSDDDERTEADESDVADESDGDEPGAESERDEEENVREAEADAVSDPVPEPEPETKPEIETQEPEVTPPTVEEQKALYQKAFEALQESYKLTPKDVEAIQVSPEEVLPRLFAGIHLNLQQQMTQQMQQTLAQAVPQILQRKEVAEKTEQSFYTRWPQLKAHHSEVTRFAGVWRQLNPNAPLEEAVEKIGKHVSLELGYDVGGQEQGQQVTRPKHHSPAAPTAVVPPAPPKQKNQFEALAEEFLDDED